MRRLFANKLTWLAAAMLAVAICWTLSPAVVLAHGTSAPPPPWEQIRVAHGTSAPPPPWEQIRIAHGTSAPPPPWEQIRVAA